MHRACLAELMGLVSMKLRFDDTAEAFRARVPRVAGGEPPVARRHGGRAVGVDGPRAAVGDATGRGKMFDDGWLVPGWPPERGGRNAGAVETIIYMEELYKARMPRTTNVQGLGIIAPSILDYGTPGSGRGIRHADPARREDGVPRHERARRGQRPRLAELPRRARRRQLRHQRPEGVDVGRELRRLLLPVLPHRSRRAEAQGHLDRARRHEHARHHGAAAARDHPSRASRPERGVLRRRRRAGARTSSAR